MTITPQVAICAELSMLVCWLATNASDDVMETKKMNGEPGFFIHQYGPRTVAFTILAKPS